MKYETNIGWSPLKTGMTECYKTHNQIFVRAQKGSRMRSMHLSFSSIPVKFLPCNLIVNWLFLLSLAYWIYKVVIILSHFRNVRERHIPSLNYIQHEI